MKQKKMNWKEMSIGLCLVALLAWFTFYVLLSGHSPQTLGSTFVRADIRFVFMGFACMFLFVNCEAANIRLLMRTFGKKVSYWRSLSYAFTDFYFTSITPSATEGSPCSFIIWSGTALGQPTVHFLCWPRPRCIR